MNYFSANIDFNYHRGSYFGEHHLDSYCFVKDSLQKFIIHLVHLDCENATDIIQNFLLPLILHFILWPIASKV